MSIGNMPDLNFSGTITPAPETWFRCSEKFAQGVVPFIPLIDDASRRVQGTRDMETPQFIHLAAYGRSPARGERAWMCISGILEEGGRAAGAVGHLRNPVPPDTLYGVAPVDLIGDALQLSRTAVDAKGRRLRCDGSVLVAGVASYPQSIEEMHRDPVDRDVYLLWRTQTLHWLKERFKETLRSVVEHFDEERPHLHFYMLPSLNADRSLDWTHAHPGMAAKRRFAAEGEDRRNQERRYREAMRAFQDDYFKHVGQQLGHDRFGPCRERVARMERDVQKRLEAKAREMLDRVRAAEHEALVQAEYRARERSGSRVAQMQAALEKSVSELEAERKRNSDLEAELVRLRTMVDEKQDFKMKF